MGPETETRRTCVHRACQDRGAVDRLDHSCPPIRRAMQAHTLAGVPGYDVDFTKEITGH